jgi:EAL domain-containing protein (putative c-di-GMP-specific phosphodiesterase class I)
MRKLTNVVTADRDIATSRAAELPCADFTALDLLFLMRRVVDQALSLIPAGEAAVIERVDGDVLTCVCASGNLKHGVGTRVPLRGSLSGLALRTGATLACDDSAVDERVDNEACRGDEHVSLVCVPLRRGVEVVCVLKLSSSRPYAFDAHAVSLLSSLAAFMGDAIAGWADVARSATAVLAIDRLANERLIAFDSMTGGRREETAATEQFVANVLQPGTVDDRDARHRVEAVLAGSGLLMHFQPIVDLKTNRLAGCEALARFAGQPVRTPDRWFAEAERVGLGPELQLAAVRMALAQLPRLPPQAYMAINVGPDVAGAPELLRLLHAVDSQRVVVELTEHLRVEDYRSLVRAVRSIRATGARLAIDDTGAGYATFSSILNLAPDLIKLDRILTTSIDVDPARQALAGALVSFAAATRAKVIAEGIETVGELDAIRQLGIGYGQGYLLGRPGPPARLARQATSHRPPTPAQPGRRPAE